MYAEDRASKQNKLAPLLLKHMQCIYHRAKRKREACKKIDLHHINYGVISMLKQLKLKELKLQFEESFLNLAFSDKVV